MSQLVRIFSDVHMGLGHPGLVDMARKHGVHAEKLEPNELILFVNTAKDKLKLLGGNGKVIAYLRSPNKQKLNISALRFIPLIFSARGVIDYNQALKMELTRTLGERMQPSPQRVQRRTTQHAST